MLTDAHAVRHIVTRTAVTLVAATLMSALAAPEGAVANAPEPPSARTIGNSLPERVARHQHIAPKCARPNQSRRKCARAKPRGLSRRLHIRARTAGAAEGYTPTWTQCENAYMLVSQPLMFGYGNDSNWVSVQHGVFKLIGGSWQPQAWGPAGFAQGYYSRVSPTTAWMLQNGTRIPRTFRQENYWGYGSYRMATYMTWYDSSNRVVRTQSVWGSLRLGGTPVSSCALGATSNITTYNS